MTLNIHELFDAAPPADFALAAAKGGATPIGVNYRAAEKAVDLINNSGNIHGQWRLQFGTLLQAAGAFDFTLEVDIEVLASSTGEIHTGFHLRSGNGDELWQLVHYKPSNGVALYGVNYSNPAGAWNNGNEPISNYTYRPMVIGGRYRMKAVRLGTGKKISFYINDELAFDYLGIADTTKVMPAIFVYNTNVRIHSLKFESSYSDPQLVPIKLPTLLAANEETKEKYWPQPVSFVGIPPVFSGKSAEFPSQKMSLFSKGRDFFIVRDGVQTEQGFIESTVTISGVGVRRRVLCYLQDGELVGETFSRESDGLYRFDHLWLNRRYMLVAQDDPAFGPADYNAVAADFQMPKPYPPGGGAITSPFAAFQRK